MSKQLEELALSIKQAQDRQHRALDAALAEVGITLVQWHAMREIDRNPGCSQSALSALTFNSNQALGTLLQRLAKSGLVTHESGGGRAITHTLTPEGKARMEQGRSVVHRVYKTLFGAINADEREQLLGLLRKMLATG